MFETQPKSERCVAAFGEQPSRKGARGAESWAPQERTFAPSLLANYFMGGGVN